jgi:intein/homing endonuclease
VCSSDLYDFENNIITEKEVYNIENGESDKKWLKLSFDNDTIIKCTEDHKFFTKNRGWVEAKDLIFNDEFLEDKIL